MLPGLYSATAAVQVAEKSQEAIATNLAHIDTPGYRRIMARVFSIPHETLPGATTPPVARTEVDVDTSFRDFTPGPTVHTGRSLDLALQGDGFFEVEGPDGPLFTRNGVLQWTAEGELVTNGGYPLAGEQGPILLPAEMNGEMVTIQPDGTILGNGAPIGQLKVVSMDDPRKLVAVSDTLFSRGSAEVRQGNSTVLQGYREKSNVNATDELVRMIVGMRLHESTQRAMRSVSDAVRQHINVEGG